MRFIPDLLTMEDGQAVTAASWPRRREQLLEILRREEYGILPPIQTKVRGEVVNVDRKCACGKGVIETVALTVETPKGAYTFPIRYAYPSKGTAHPTFLFINLREGLYDKYIDIDGIIEEGFAVAGIYYEDVTSDNADLNNGLCTVLERPDSDTAFGKISVWAFAMSRLLDYLQTRPEADMRYIASIGHSRLGKTSLWCAAQDERIGLAISNDSGCAGAAYERHIHPQRETYAKISQNFPFWFCPRFVDNALQGREMAFDQHFLLAAIAPRRVCIGSAVEDLWADPYAEQLSCIAATPVWRLLGKTGYTGKEAPMAVGEKSVGEISYHLRDGVHYLGRPDWRFYCECFRKFVEETQ